MNIAVVAANGRSGRAFVSHALAEGHTIRAGIYGVSDLPLHPKLTVVKCDATVEEDLLGLVAGQDAVVSFIGHVKGSPAYVQTEAMRAIHSAMRASNVYRLISLTGTGVRFPGDRITITDRILNLTISLIDHPRIIDGKSHVAFLQQTDLDWTVLRVLKLQNTPPTPFVLTPHGPTKLYVSREEVAKAVLEVIEHKSFVRQAPILAPARYS